MLLVGRGMSFFFSGGGGGGGGGGWISGTAIFFYGSTEKTRGLSSN